jgi:opacity protein-like surface antigen
MTRATLLAAATAAALALPAAAPAVVPPKDCGNIKVSGKRYNIKADQISCASGRKYAKNKLSGHGAPRGYKCKKPASGSALKVYCSSGKKVFFAIRR